MKRRGKIFLGVVLFLFIGFSIVGLFVQGAIENKFYESMPEEVENKGDVLLNNMIEGNYEGVFGSLIKEYRVKATSYNDVKALTDMFKSAGQLLEKRIIGYHVNNTNGIMFYQVTYELEFENKFFVFSYVLTDAEGGLKTYGINVNESDVSLIETSKFSLKDTTITDYVVLILTYASLIFSLVTATICFNSDKKKRVAWSLFALCGIGIMTYVWRTGTINYGLWSIGFPTGGFGRAGTSAPIVFSARFPVGAVMYWMIKHRSEEDTDITIDEILEDVDLVE